MANRILVVDDEAEIADLIEAYLTGENYAVWRKKACCLGVLTIFKHALR